MNTHLQISSFLYVSFIAFIYFRKKKINTLENGIYTSLLLFMLLTIIMDLISTIYALNNPITFTTETLIKAYLWLLISWVYIFSYYVFAISAPYSAGAIDFKEHPNKQYFKRAKTLTSVGITIICLWISLVDINIYVNREIYLYDGPAMIIAYISTAIGVITWVGMLIKNRKNIKNKKYIPVFAFFILAILTIISQILIPNISLVTPMAAFITVLIYFTLENPDLHMIEKLNVTKEEAETANTAKTDFLSSMSHEIRTPLNAIIGFSQALAKEDISGRAKDEIKDILTASNNLLDIVNGILDISKIEANKIEIVNVDYSTRKLIKDTSCLINARIGSKLIDFKMEIDEKLPKVLHGDSMRVKQILINLLTNAVKYTKEGHIKLTIKAAKRNENCRLTIIVEDTGIGMTEEDLEKIFTKFQRFNMNKNVNVEGTGLGMAITKGLVEMMNGEISVQSKYGKGSIFTVEIDQQFSTKKVEEIEEQVESNIETFNAAGQKVMVVDDNKINLKVAERLLREYNVSVELVVSGKECINRILDGKKYDLIFLDIMMPKMKGPEVLQNLRNIIGFKTPVVALTADVISGMEEKYISQGFDDCLPKPIIEEELYHILRKYLKENKNASKEITSNELSKAAKGSLKILEQNGVNVKQGLELLKDIEMYNITITEFFEELEEKIFQLETYKNNKDLDSYSILAHSLKTEARYLGFNDLADMSYEHELASKENNLDFVNKNYRDLKMESIRIYDIIKKYLGER